MLSGSKILIIEDEFLVAFDLEDTVTEAGATASIVHDVSNALAAISASEFAAAVVDCNLNDQSIEPVLEALVEKHIPFVFHSGSPSMERFSNWPACDVVSKPATPERIKQAVTRALAA